MTGSGAKASLAGLVALLLCVGALAVAFRAMTPIERSPGYRPPTELPVRAVYRVSSLGAEVTGSRDHVIKRATLNQHAVYVYTRRGDSWREVVLWASPLNDERPGDYEAYTPGSYRSRHGDRVFTESTEDEFVPRQEMSLVSYGNLIIYLRMGDLTEGRPVPCGEGVVCGRLVRSEYTANDSPGEEPPVNVTRTTTLYDPQTGLFRYAAMRYNGEVRYEFQLLCAEPGPDPCADDDLPPEVRAKGVSLAARVSPS